MHSPSLSLTLPVPHHFSLTLGLPPLVAFFLLWVSLVTGLGVGCPSAFGGPLYPFYYSLLQHRPIMRCYLLPLASALLYTHPPAWVPSLVFFMSFSHCTFFYSSLFFSLDFPSLPFVFGAAHLSFFVSCGGVVRCHLGLFLAVFLFPTSIPFLGILLVSAGFLVCDLLCLFFHEGNSCYVPWFGMGCHCYILTAVSLVHLRFL